MKTFYEWAEAFDPSATLIPWRITPQQKEKIAAAGQLQVNTGDRALELRKYLKKISDAVKAQGRIDDVKFMRVKRRLDDAMKILGEIG